MTQPQLPSPETAHQNLACEPQSTEAALRASEERYRSLVNSLDSSVAMFDVNGMLLFINEQGAHVFNRPPETLVGKYMTDLFPPDVATRQLHTIQEVIGTGEGYVSETPSTIGTEARWYRTSVQPVRDANGHVTAALINALDITQSKATENALRLSEEKFRGLLETAPEAVIVCDAQGQIRLLNQQAQLIFGYSADELIDQNIEVLVPETARTTHADLFAEYVQRPRNRHLNNGYQLKARCKDGRTIPVEIGLGYSNYNGELVVMCFLIDLTDRQQADAILKHQASLLQRVSDAIITLDNEGRITSWNKAATYIYGWAEEEVLGLVLSQLLHSEFLHQSREEAWAQVRSGSTWRGEIIQQTKAGELRFILSSSNQLRDSEQMTGVVVVNRDITERKRREVLQKRISEILEMVAVALPLASILEHLVLAIEEFQPEVRASILLMDQAAQRLMHGAAPSLPEAYNVKINGLQIGPKNGSCGTAAYEKRMVVVENTQTDPLWSNYRELAALYDLRACWSQPIIDHEDNVLGTFALYYSQPRLPADSELELIQLASHIAGIAIRRVQTETEKRQAQVALQGAHDLLEQRVSERTAELEHTKNQMEQKYEAERVFQLYLLALHEASIVLARTDTLDAFYRSVVQVGRDYFGFDRMGLILLDAKNKQAHGTYGYNLKGEFVDEYHLQMPLEQLPEIFKATMERGERFALNEQAQIYSDFEVVGVGSQATTALWDGELLGWLAVDNALQHQPFSPIQLDVLSLYATTVGSLLARKTAEEKARLLSWRLDMATQAGGIGIMEWDLQKQVCYWDARLCAIHGIAPSDEPFPEDWVNHFIHPEDREAALQQAQEAMSVALTHSDSFRIVRPDGSIRHIRLNSVLLHDNNKVPERVIGVVWDITDQKRSEEALRQALETEQELGELKSRFVSMASHEFRTPLAAIMALAESLSIYRHKMDATQIELRLEKIRQQVDHMIDIMDDVLQLARMQSGRLDFAPAEGDLDALCREVIEELDLQSPNRGRIVYTSPAAPLLAKVDVRLMRQVIGNLVANALKYSPPEQIVKLELTQDNVNIFIRVLDKGIGIPPEDQKHLFESFHRGRNVGTIPGTGLGLSIARQFVELHGGTIRVESAVDVGTAFIVTMPIDSVKGSEDG